MGRTQERTLADANREEAPAANRRRGPRRLVLATAAGLGLLASTAISATATQPTATGPRTGSAVSHYIAEPCPCKDPVCRPACQQN
jgi:hypothetical protein